MIIAIRSDYYLIDDKTQKELNRIEACLALKCLPSQWDKEKARDQELVKSVLWAKRKRLDDKNG